MCRLICIRAECNEWRRWNTVIFYTVIAYTCSLTYISIYFLRVSFSWYKARPVHIDSHDILSVGREAGHSGGVLKWRSNLNQIPVRVRYRANVGAIATVTRSLPVVDVEVVDVAGAVVAIYNVPGEGDVGAVLVGLEVTNSILGICKCLT